MFNIQQDISTVGGQDSLLLATSKQNKKKSKEDMDLGDILLSGKYVRVHVPWHLL